MIDFGSERPVESGASGVVAASRVETDDASSRIHCDEPAADCDRASRGHPSVVDDGEFGRAAADIEIEDAAALLAREAHSAGPVCGEHRLHMMAGSRGDEFAAFLG